VLVTAKGHEEGKVEEREKGKKSLQEKHFASLNTCGETAPMERSESEMITIYIRQKEHVQRQKIIGCDVGEDGGGGESL